MIINSENIKAMFQAYLTAWQAGIKIEMMPDISFLSQDFPSTTKANFYAWMDKIPGFRQWVGERLFNNITAQRFIVPNVPFEASLSVPREDLLDDSYGIYSPIIGGMGQNWPVTLRELVLLDALVKNPLTYTGTKAFGTHVLSDKSNITNFTANPLTKASFEAACVAAAAWKFADGSSLKGRFTHLIVGETKRSVAHAIVKAPTTATIVTNQAGSENVGGVAVENPNFGRCELVVVPEFSGDYANCAVLVCADRGIKPIARQIREQPSPKMDPDTFRIEKENKVDFIATGRAAAAPTFPWLVYGFEIPGAA